MEAFWIFDIIVTICLRWAGIDQFSKEIHLLANMSSNLGDCKHRNQFD